MEIDIKQLIELRTQAIDQFTEDSIAPEDLLFYVINGEVGMSLIPFEGDFPPSQKYDVRKQVLQSILLGTLNSQLINATRLIYFSVDMVYNVDYCFDVDNNIKTVSLYIVKNNKIVRRYKKYDIMYDERNDIAQL